MPNGSSPSDLSKSKFPVLLAKILGRAAEEAFPATDVYTFLPLSTISYQDGQRMLTMTGIVIKKPMIQSLLEETELYRWTFYSHAYYDVKTFNVAVLTMKERLLMERLAVSTEDVDVATHLGFERFGKLKISDYFDEFKLHARFYPTHAQIDL